MYITKKSFYRRKCPRESLRKCFIHTSSMLGLHHRCLGTRRRFDSDVRLSPVPSSCSIRFNTISITYVLPAPSAASQCYNLQRRPHTQLLPQHRGHLMDSNFITRILYNNIYWRYYETIHTYTESWTNCYYIPPFCHCCNHLAFCQARSSNEYVTLCYIYV